MEKTDNQVPQEIMLSPDNIDYIGALTAPWAIEKCNAICTKLAYLRTRVIEHQQRTNRSPITIQPHLEVMYRPYQGDVQVVIGGHKNLIWEGTLEGFLKPPTVNVEDN